MNRHILHKATVSIIEHLENSEFDSGIDYGSLSIAIKYTFLDSSDTVLQDRLETTILDIFNDVISDNSELKKYMIEELERFNYNDRIKYILNLIVLTN